MAHHGELMADDGEHVFLSNMSVKFQGLPSEAHLLGPWNYLSLSTLLYSDPVAVYQPSANLYSQFSSYGSDQRDQGIYGIRR